MSALTRSYVSNLSQYFVMNDRHTVVVVFSGAAGELIMLLSTQGVCSVYQRWHDSSLVSLCFPSLVCAHTPIPLPPNRHLPLLVSLRQILKCARILVKFIALCLCC